MPQVWPPVVRLLDTHGICALVTVVSVRGSAPRESGARMIIGPGGAGFSGTIGGGELEWRALGAAQRALAEGTPSAALSRYSLGPELGQCCGGSVEVLSEVLVAGQLDAVRALAAREKVGPFLTHARIGRRAVERIPVEDSEGETGAAATAPLPFAVTWIDERRGAFPSVLPQHVRTIESPNATAELAAAPSDAAIVVMTHSHPLDLAMVHAALAAARFSYVGLIGSASKRTRFVHRLRSAGLPNDLTDALVCPIGLPRIRSRAPAALAAGVAAQLLERLPA